MLDINLLRRKYYLLSIRALKDPVATMANSFASYSRRQYISRLRKWGVSKGNTTIEDNSPLNIAQSDHTNPHSELDHNAELAEIIKVQSACSQARVSQRQYEYHQQQTPLNNASASPAQTQSIIRGNRNSRSLQETQIPSYQPLIQEAADIYLHGASYPPDEMNPLPNEASIRQTFGDVQCDNKGESAPTSLEDSDLMRADSPTIPPPLSIDETSDVISRASYTADNQAINSSEFKASNVKLAADFLFASGFHEESFNLYFQLLEEGEELPSNQELIATSAIIWCARSAATDPQFDIARDLLQKRLSG